MLRKTLLNFVATAFVWHPDLQILMFTAICICAWGANVLTFPYVHKELDRAAALSLATNLFTVYGGLFIQQQIGIDAMSVRPPPTSAHIVCCHCVCVYHGLNPFSTMLYCRLWLA
jgi:hypothetical protein